MRDTDEVHVFAYQCQNRNCGVLSMAVLAVGTGGQVKRRIDFKPRCVVCLQALTPVEDIATSIADALAAAVNPSYE